MAKKKQRRPTSSARRRPEQNSARPVAAALDAREAHPTASSTGRRPAQHVAAQSRKGVESHAMPAATPAAPAKVIDFASEYRYVLGDLRRIGILAAGMFATLVALSFIIR